MKEANTGNVCQRSKKDWRVVWRTSAERRSPVLTASVRSDDVMNSRAERAVS